MTLGTTILEIEDALLKIVYIFHEIMPSDLPILVVDFVRNYIALYVER
jgi:hypothetical protein